MNYSASGHQGERLDSRADAEIARQCRTTRFRLVNMQENFYTAPATGEGKLGAGRAQITPE
jgi:hypothetical protein